MSEICKDWLKHEDTGKVFHKNMLLPAELKRKTKVLQFDMCCKAIGRNFNCEDWFLHDSTSVPHSIWHFHSKNSGMLFMAKMVTHFTVVNIIWTYYLYF